MKLSLKDRKERNHESLRYLYTLVMLHLSSGCIVSVLLKSERSLGEKFCHATGGLLVAPQCPLPLIRPTFISSRDKCF